MSLLATTIAVASSTPLDDFLGGADRTVRNAERVRDIGATLSTFGLLMSVGALVFLARVHRGPRSEIRTLLLLAGLGGVGLLTGAVAELAGIQSAFQTGWRDVLSVDVSSAAMLRLIAGLLVVFGLTDTTDTTDTTDVVGADSSRWLPGVESSFGIVGLAVGALSYSFDGHTVTEGPRPLHLLADLTHVTAGGVWFGGIVSLVVLGVVRRRSDRSDHSIADLIVRFSSVATVALVAVAVAGAAMAVMILDEPGELTSTVWGRRLAVKLVGVAIAAAIGGYHHWVTVPRLSTPDVATPADVSRAATLLVVETIALVFVVVTTGLLVAGSTA